jgi:uncharacterized Rmd1/YagE family protein
MQTYKPEIYSLIDSVRKDFAELGVIVSYDFDVIQKLHIISLISLRGKRNLNRAYVLFDYNAFLYGYNVEKVIRTIIQGFPALKIYVRTRKGKGETKVVW